MKDEQTKSNGTNGATAVATQNGNGTANSNKGKDRKPVRSRSPAKRARSRSPVDRRDRNNKALRRVYVANVAFEVKWSDLKDLFREKVGNVQYCQIFEDEQGRSRGCGLVEFGDVATAKKAIEIMHRFNYKDRELVVREDIEGDRDEYGRLIPSSKKDSRNASRPDDRRVNPNIMFSNQGYGAFNTFGLSPSFLESLGISGGPLNNRIFVANLEYKVGEKKLEEIFRLAGKVLRVRLYTDTNGTSKGYATVEYEHPVEAVQAISMFRNQNLYGRPMSIRMDKYEVEEMPEELPNKLPSGLDVIGKGLGFGGQPLNVGKSLLNGGIGSSGGLVPPQAQPIQTPGPVVGQPMQPAVPTAYGAQAAMGNASYGAMGMTAGAQQLAPGNPLAAGQISQVGQVAQPQQQQIGQGLASIGLGGMNTNSLSAQQNLNQLANTAQNVLAAAAAASFGSNTLGNTLNPIAPQQAGPAGNMYGGVGSQYEREFRDRSTLSAPIGSGAQVLGAGGVQPISVDTVLVRNLPLSFTWSNLRDRFSEVADVRYAEVKGRGIAVVRFASDRDAQRAIELMNGMRIENRPIEVTPFTGVY